MGGVHMDSVTFDEEFLQTIKMSLSSLKYLLKRSFVSSLFQKSLDVFFGDPLSKKGAALIVNLCGHCYDLINLLEYINTVSNTMDNVSTKMSHEIFAENLLTLTGFSA
ncbi:hypothetical protein HDU92_002473 [Lobulomyces angularis]|nr:hypothetical protein HDU92_002473 [Lobulomyces angularis]